jgi:hypothetical protein
VRRSHGKVATSFSGTYNTTDDDDGNTNERLLSTTTLSDKDDVDQSRRVSNDSSITNFTINKISNEFYGSSLASSLSSRMNMPTSSSSMIAISSQQSLAVPLVDTNVVGTKPKSDIRSFLRNMFRPSSNSARSQGNTTSKSVDSSKYPSLNVDLASGTAYAPMRPLPITQGPIRLLLLRHGERLDRYYSSQWLRQAFDKDGNFCRFSPILP